MNKQEIFDRVWDHFVVEGKPIAIRNGTCVYYDPDTGNRCAIGIFGSGFQEQRQIGAQHWDVVYRNFGENVDISFLSALQSAHDGSAFGCVIERNLLKVAETFKLQVPVLA